MENSHGWLHGANEMDAVSHKTAHCLKDTPLRVSGYYIGLDPAKARHNTMILNKFENAAQEHAERIAARRRRAAGGESAAD